MSAFKDQKGFYIIIMRKDNIMKKRDLIRVEQICIFKMWGGKKIWMVGEVPIT